MEVDPDSNNGFVLNHRLSSGDDASLVKIRPYLLSQSPESKKVYFEPEYLEFNQLDELECLKKVSFEAKIGIIITGKVSYIESEHLSNI